MAAVIDPNAAANTSIIDGVYGTVNSFVDLWGKWQTTKTNTQAAKAAIQVTQPANASVTSAGGVFNSKVVLWAAGIALALVAVIFVFRRPSK